MPSASANSLSSWFVQNGGFINDAAELVEDDDRNISVIARHDINAERGLTLVLRCPLSVTISYLNACPQSVRPDLDKIRRYPESKSSRLAGKVPPSVVANFFLAEQSLIKDGSYWAPYVASLPGQHQFTTPLYFEEKDLMWLKGTNLLNASQAVMSSRMEEHKNGLEILGSEGIDVSGFSWKLYLWASTIFTSRGFASDDAFHIEGELFSLLCPLMDALNHKNRSKVTWSTEDQKFIINTEESLKTGEEIFNNYGARSNEQLLFSYGFAVEDNVADGVTVRLGPAPTIVHETMKRDYPGHFKSEEWNGVEATFQLRGPGHFARYSSTGHGIDGVPPIMFALFKELAFYERNTTGDQGRRNIPLNSLCELSARRTLLSQLFGRRMAITANDATLPSQPQNLKQMYAKIYRESQVKILHDLIKELEEDLRLGSMNKDDGYPHFVLGSLEDALNLLLKEFSGIHRQFTSGIEAFFQTSDLDALFESGWEDVIWIIFMCVARICTTVPPESVARSHLNAWISAIGEAYPIHSAATEGEDELADDLADTIEAAVAAAQQSLNPNLIWTDNMWSPELIAWGMKVVGTEGWQASPDSKWEGKYLMPLPSVVSADAQNDH
ncbi:hypothetical protein BDY21DRAFT_160128 [Lineolata rhizophorae]|uniref:SET domain-containing protein n=1 Tax=Lineolata rhizophorae TaxID=578093 RepID=A0A6A6P8I0_9PEZI|nr:hypothetical protein BDY21DRAFT_160128 [Lineolata rhizophorae]